MMFIAICFLSFITNCAYALYVKYIATNNPLNAAIFGELVVLSGAIATINYVQNYFYIIPLIIGGFLGTLLSSKVEKLFKQ